MQNVKQGLTNLLNRPDDRKQFAIDVFWFNLQVKDRWYLITPPTVVQREDYSDIEKRPTNYTRVMTDLSKEWLMKQKQNIKMNSTHHKSPISLSKINFSTQSYFQYH